MNNKPYNFKDKDYNTNAPSYYDALARFNEALKNLTDRMNDVENRFKDLVLQWLEDGTLAGLLEQVLLDDYATEVYVQQMIDDLNIEDYATIDYVNSEIQNFIDDINDNFSSFKDDINDNFSSFKDDINDKLEKFIINIDEFDGSDTEKIQKSLNKARDLNGGVVYVPARNYILDDELIIYKNTTLWSVQGTKYIRDHSGYMLMNGVRGENYRRYDGHGNIKIINGEFDGKAQNGLSGIASNIALAHADGILIDNVTVTNANSHSIEINSSKNVTIRNCKILGQLSSMQYVEGIQLDLATKNGFPAFGEHDNTSCKNVHIHNCYFGASEELPSLSRGIGTHATRIGAFMENVLIENNEFNSLRDFAIQFLCYKNSTVRNNEFYKCTGGIICYSSNPDNENHILDIYNNVTTSVQPCTNITIERNTFALMSGKQIIYCYGRETSRNENFKILNNVIVNSKDISGVINVIYTDEAEISGNKIYDVGNFGIYVKSSSFIDILNNKLSHINTHSAIRVTTKIRYLNISGNQIFKTGGNCINVLKDVFTINISNNLCMGSNGIKEDYDGIYCHSDGGKIVVTGNIIRSLTDFVHEHAIYITSTIEDGIVSNNVSDMGNNETKYASVELTEVNNI